MGEFGAGYAMDFSELMNNLSTKELIAFEEKMRTQNPTDRFNALSEMFGKLSEARGLSYEKSQALSNLSKMFEQIAVKASEVGTENYSLEWLMKAMDELKEENPQFFEINNENKYKASLIAKYQV